MIEVKRNRFKIQYCLVCHYKVCFIDGKTDTFKPFITITKVGKDNSEFRFYNDNCATYYYEPLFSCPDCGIVQTLIVREPDYNDKKLLDSLERTVM